MYHAHPKVRVNRKYSCSPTMVLEVHHSHYKGKIYVVYRESHDVYRIYKSRGSRMIQQHPYLFEYEIGPFLDMIITGNVDKALEERLNLRKMGLERSERLSS